MKNEKIKNEREDWRRGSSAFADSKFRDDRGKSSVCRRFGFTLIEIILYIALIAIMLSALLPFALSMIDSGEKSQVNQEVDAAARYAGERILYEIRNASSVNIGDSSFGTDLAASSGAMLSLGEASSSADPTVFSVASGTLMITQGTASSVALNSAATRVAHLVFSNYSTGTYYNVGFVLTMAGSSTSTRNEYQASTTIESAAEVRSR